MIRQRTSFRLILLIALSLLISLFTVGLFKVTLEAALPGTPWLQKLVRYEETGTAAAGGSAPSRTPEYEYDLGRASRRYLLLVTIVVFVTGRRWIPWRALTRRGWRTPERRRLVLFGFSVSAALVLLYGVLLMASGHAAWQVAPAAYLLRKIPEFAVTGVLVALLEELFFRGVMFRAMLRDWGTTWAFTVSSAIYGVLHCISGGYRVVPGWDPAIGLHLVRVFFTDAGGSVWPDIRLTLGLFLLGWLLAYLYLRTGSLWASMGLHAGIVFFSKTMKKLIGRGDGFPEWLLGDSLFIVSGVLCWLLLLAALWAVARLAPRGPLYRRLGRTPT